MLLRHALSILLLPFVVTVVVPRALQRSSLATTWSDAAWLAWPARLLGAVVLLGGFALFGWCVALFARVGRGTLAPWDPTRRLVAVGPYRTVRNPMISAVVAILAGEALLLGSLPIAAWAAAFMLINHAYFILAEEPGLERRFGEEYRRYRAQVPRWLPRKQVPGAGCQVPGRQKDEKACQPPAPDP